MDPTYPLFPIFACISWILLLIPLPWHLEAMNTGTVMFMLWASLYAFCAFVNSIVWRDNTLNVAPVWCDITTRVVIGASVAIPASSLCIQRRLYKIAAIQAVTITKREKIRAVLVDLSISLLFPIIIIVLQYIVEGHRFNIFEEVGCYPDTYNTPAAYFLLWMWPVVLGTISLCYCVLTLRAFLMRRAQFMEYLSSNKSMSFSRYFRLMAICIIEMLLTVPLGSWLLWINATTSPVNPYISWENVHLDFSRVDEIPAVFWRADKWTSVSLMLNQWFSVLFAVCFFGLFGFAEEARKHYWRWFCYVASIFGYHPKQKKKNTTLVGSNSWGTPKGALSSGTNSNGGGATLPIFISQRKVVKRDSFFSSSGDLTSSFDVETIDEPKGSPTESFSDASFSEASPVDELVGLPRLPIVTVSPAHPVDVPHPIRPLRPDSDPLPKDLV